MLEGTFIILRLKYSHSIVQLSSVVVYLVSVAAWSCNTEMMMHLGQVRAASGFNGLANFASVGLCCSISFDTAVASG